MPGRRQRQRRQKRERQARRRANRDPLLNPGVPLAGRRLRRAANQLTAAEFRPRRQALNREASAVSSTGERLAGQARDYYLQLAQQELGNVDKMRALGTGLQADVAAAGATAQQQLDAAGQQAAQLRAADAAVRGAGNDVGMPDAAAELAAARARSAALQQQGATAAAQTTGNWAGLADASRTARGAAGGEAVTDFLRDVAIRRADVRRRRADLDTMAGTRRAENILKLRQQGYENAITARGLDVDMAQLQADMQNARANRRVQRRGQDVTARGQTLSARERRADRAARERQAQADRESRERIARARSKGEKLEPADARKLRIGVANALADLQSKKPAHPERWLRNQGAPGIVIEAAMERYRRGGITTATARELRRLGVRVPRAWLLRPADLGPGDIPIAGNILQTVFG